LSDPSRAIDSTKPPQSVFEPIHVAIDLVA